MMNDESKVIQFPETHPPVESPPVQDEKIILFQLVSPNQCIFICLSNDDNENKLEIGVIRR